MRRKMHSMMILALGFGFALCCGTAPAQEMPKPGAEHKLLEPLIGKWTCKIKVWMDPAKGPEESDGTMNRKWIMDGRYIQEDFEGKFGGTTFTGLGIFGYDTIKKKFVGTWIDTMSTAIAMFEGGYDAGTKTFTVTMDEFDPMTKTKTKHRDSIRIVSNDHILQEMYHTPEGGKEFKAMEIQYHRVKK